MKIKHNNKDYVLDVEQSIKLGVLKPEKRPVTYNDIKENTIFRFAKDGVWINALFVRRNGSNIRLYACDSHFTDGGNSINFPVKGCSGFGLSNIAFAILRDDGTYQTEFENEV